MIKEEVYEALNNLNVPVRFKKYIGDAETYITFFEYNNQVEECSEDIVEIEGHYIQVDIWSKVNYEQLVKSVKTAMKNAGFDFINGEDLNELETGLNHKGLRFNKAEYLEDETQIISV